MESHTSSSSSGRPEGQGTASSSTALPWAAAQSCTAGTMAREPPDEAGRNVARPDPGTDPGKTKEDWTTLMLQNLPSDYTRSMLLDWLDSNGLAGRYDFLYYPIDFTRRAGLGYAFINMCTAADAEIARGLLEGFSQWCVPSNKICSVAWSHPCQGFKANVERYRSSPVMHRVVPDEFKPITMADGVRIDFPAPTRRVRRPALCKLG